MTEFWKGKTVLVTGATGFIGSNLLKRLLQEEGEVHILVRENSSLNRIEGLTGNYTKHTADLTDFEAIKTIINQLKPDIIFHLAAYGVDYRQQDMHKAIAINIDATANLFGEFLSNKGIRFIHTGTCFEYGHKNTSISEYDLPNPTTLYSATKTSATYLLSNMAKGMRNGSLVILRPFAVFGEGEDSARFSPQIITNLIEGQSVKMTPGEQIRDYVYVKDLVDAYILAGVSPLENPVEIINIGSGKGVSLKNISLLISKQLDASNDLLKFGELHYRSDEMMYLVSNISKAKKLLGWEPKTSIEEGIRRIVRYHESKKVNDERQ